MNAVAGEFEVYEDRAGLHRWRLKAGNGQVVAVGEAYETRAAATKGCEAVQQAAQGAPVAESAAAARATGSIRSDDALDGASDRAERPLSTTRPADAPDAADGQALADGARRREAVAEALSSVRAEGLEPSVEGLRLLEAIAVGRVDEDDAIDALVRRHRR